MYYIIVLPTNLSTIPTPSIYGCSMQVRFVQFASHLLVCCCSIAAIRGAKDPSKWIRTETALVYAHRK